MQQNEVLYISTKYQISTLSTRLISRNCHINFQHSRGQGKLQLKEYRTDILGKLVKNVCSSSSIFFICSRLGLTKNKKKIKENTDKEL